MLNSSNLCLYTRSVTGSAALPLPPAVGLGCQVCLCSPLVKSVSGGVFVVDVLFFVFGCNLFGSNHG